jgi:hypothetical protein
MCGQNAFKEVMAKVLQKVQVGVGEDWGACWKRSVSGGRWLFISLHIRVKTDHFFLLNGGHRTPFICSSWVAASSRLCQIIIWFWKFHFDKQNILEYSKRWFIAGSSTLCQLIFWELTCLRHQQTWWPSYDGVRIITWSLHYKRCKLKGSDVFFMHSFDFSLHFDIMFQTYFVTLKPKPMNHKRQSYT